MLSPQITGYRVNKKEQFCSEFLSYYFQTDSFQFKLNTLAEQTTRKYIGITEQKKLWSPYPPYEEQVKIVEVLLSIDGKIDLNIGYLMKLQNIKQALMQDLLTGAVRVPLEEATG